MVKLRFFVALVIVICLTMVSLGVVFADEGAGDRQLVPDDRQIVPEDRSPERERPAVDDEISLKHREVDGYLFDENAGYLEEMGIKITHTAPTDEGIEIGIMPFNEENAAYIYSVLGEEQITVVQGVEYELRRISSDTSSTLLNVKPVAESASPNSTSPKLLMLYTLGVFAILGGGFAAKRWVF